mmetsp:Transcript_34032/g.63536  ORF Transcript_34032/g.63536 Transcript_34032/m.63536 type:complete len:206 (-) Transcript_34032:242-859(-)
MAANPGLAGTSLASPAVLDCEAPLLAPVQFDQSVAALPAFGVGAFTTLGADPSEAFAWLICPGLRGTCPAFAGVPKDLPLRAADSLALAAATLALASAAAALAFAAELMPPCQILRPGFWGTRGSSEAVESAAPAFGTALGRPAFTPLPDVPAIFLRASVAMYEAVLLGPEEDAVDASFFGLSGGSSGSSTSSSAIGGGAPASCR